MAWRHGEGSPLVVGPIVDVGLVQLHPVHVHVARVTAALALFFLRNSHPWLRSDLHRLSLYRDDALYEVALFVPGCEHHDVTSLRAVEQVSHVRLHIGLEEAVEEVGVIPEVETL